MNNINNEKWILIRRRIKKKMCYINYYDEIRDYYCRHCHTVIGLKHDEPHSCIMYECKNCFHILTERSKIKHKCYKCDICKLLMTYKESKKHHNDITHILNATNKVNI